jgi:hypothetical protein
VHFQVAALTRRPQCGVRDVVTKRPGLVAAQDAPAATPPCHNPHNNPDGLGDENKGCLSKTERATVGRCNSLPWKGCSPFSGRSWIVISNTTSGSLAISGRSGLQPCFACGGPKPTKTANTFRNLSVTHLKNDTANYLGLGRTRLTFSVRKHVYCAARSATPGQTPRLWPEL